MTDVLVLTAWASRMGGGLHFSVSDLIAELSRNPDFKYSVVSMSDPHSDEDAVHWRGTDVTRWGFMGPDKFRLSPRFYADVMSRRADLVQLHGIWMFPALVAACLHRAQRVPMIITPHGMLDPWILSRGKFKKFAMGLLAENYLRRSGAVYRALNLNEAKAIRAVVPDSQIVVVPNGIVLPPSKACSSASPEASADGPGLLFLGRLHEKKRVLELIEAMNRVWANSGARPKLTIAGWGEEQYVAKVRDACSRSTDQCCRLIGPVFGDQKAEVLRNCDAFILPSVSEGLPMAVLEACSYRKPCLISPGCNLDELIAAGAALRTGTDPSNIAASIAGFCRLAPTERGLIGERARVLMAQDYSWTMIAKTLSDVSLQMVEGRRVVGECVYAQ